MNIKMECKACKKLQEVALDKKTEKIHCEECKNEIPGTFFQIQKLKMAKKFRNPEPAVKGAFFVKCSKCDNLGRPKLDAGKAYCKGCLQDLNLSKFFIFGLEEYLKVNHGKDSK